MIKTGIAISLYNWLIEEWDLDGGPTSELKSAILNSLKLDGHSEHELQAVLTQVDLMQVVQTMMTPEDVLAFSDRINPAESNDSEETNPAILRRQLAAALGTRSGLGFIGHLHQAKRHMDEAARLLVFRQGCLEAAAMGEAHEAIVHRVNMCTCHFENFVDCVCDFVAELVRVTEGDDALRKVIEHNCRNEKHRMLGRKLNFIADCCAKAKPSLPDPRLLPFVSALAAIKDEGADKKRQRERPDAEEAEAEGNHGVFEKRIAATATGVDHLAGYLRQMTEFRNALSGHPGSIADAGSLPERFENCDEDVRIASECLTALLSVFSYSDEQMFVPGLGRCLWYTKYRWGTTELSFEIEREQGRIIASYIGWNPNANAPATLDECLSSGEDLFIFPLPTRNINRVYKPLIYRKRPAFE